ncbi:MAG: diguanylate cyclase [Proteobacteria bacterium]|nr:diguanylate cyclase [Pseudomonadota bacterium]MBU1056733.1 diguanylate cyclase [Pseudomonadota bacterium]
MSLFDQTSTSSELQQEVLSSLSSAPGDSMEQFQRLQPLLNKKKNEACKIILYNLIQLNFTPENTRAHWDAIVQHAKHLQTTLQRNVGLATVACDYFSTINPCLDNPKLIEFDRLEETLRSAHHDFLTGLLSRGAFQNLFEQEISRASRHGHNATLVFLDLDNFKAINDTHGHLLGDEVLKQVGKIILEAKRKEDMACRFGGDEFLILLPETSKSMAQRVSKKIHKQINKLTIGHEELQIQVACSGGLASFPLDSDTGKGMMDCADQALYQAKSTRKHQLISYAKEKRTSTRIDFKKSVRIPPLKKQENTGKSKAKNISEGGLLISSDTPYSIGTHLELQIPLQDASPLTVTGAVVRMEQFGPLRFDLGVSFLFSDVTASKAIADYIQQKRVGKQTARQML